MKIALFGHGAMGQLVEAGARKNGDEIGVVLRSKDDVSAEQLRGHDVAIDFSISDAVLKNIEACARAHVPLVEGTTGWKQHESSAKEIITDHGGAVVYGANFS